MEAMERQYLGQVGNAGAAIENQKAAAAKKASGSRSGGGGARTQKSTAEQTNDFFTGGETLLESEARGFGAVQSSIVPSGTTMRENRFGDQTYRVLQNSTEGVEVSVNRSNQGTRTLLEVNANRIIPGNSNAVAGVSNRIGVPIADRNSSNISKVLVHAANQSSGNVVIQTFGTTNKAESSAFRKAGFSPPTGSEGIQYAVVRKGKLVPAARSGEVL